MILHDQILQFLSQSGVPFETKTHAPTSTSEDSARERNEPIHIGAKALVLKTDNGLALCVLPANRSLDLKKIRAIFSTKNIRFATPEELLTATGCPKGAVPPFGHFRNIPMIVDAHQFDDEFIAFNAGDLCVSVKMKSADYKKIVNPRVEEFCKIG